MVAKSREAEDRAAKLEEELREVTINQNNHDHDNHDHNHLHDHHHHHVDMIRLVTPQSCLNSECLSLKAAKVGNGRRSLLER